MAEQCLTEGCRGVPEPQKHGGAAARTYCEPCVLNTEQEAAAWRKIRAGIAELVALGAQAAHGDNLGALGATVDTDTPHADTRGSTRG